MKNRIASLFLVFALLMSLCGNAVARDNRIVVQSGGAERFTDVPTSHWAYSYINKVVGSGLFNGMTPTAFAPSDAMTRAQFVIVMSRMEGLNVERVETPTKFPDVASTYWAAGAIAWATEAGIVGGFGDGTFKPTSPITRGQFAALIHRYIVSKRYVNLHVVDPEPAQFTDAASVSSAFTNDVEYARVHGLLTGYSDGTVRASNPITRAAIAAILARFLDLVQESGYTPLLDGPAIDGGDSGDSGTTPVETPTEYPSIKMNISGGTHGTTSIASVLRNGVQVAADDVQPGDRVTINHKPDSGYVVTVRVKDAKGKNVSVNRSSDSSWFYMPKDMPVTVTVTYTRESSGGGGGGGGGGNTSSGGYPSGGVVDNKTLYLNAAAQTEGNGSGSVVLLRTMPAETALVFDELTGVAQPMSFSVAQNATNVRFYVAVKADSDSKLDSVKVFEGATGSTETGTVGTAVTQGDYTYYPITVAGKNTRNATADVRVVVTFTKSSTTPDTWTLTASVDGGYVAISTDPSTFKAEDVTSGAKTSATSAEVAKTQKLYVAFTRDADSEGDPTVTPSTLTKNTANSKANSLWVYEVTNSTTSVSAVFKATNKVGATNAITVNAELDDGTTPDGLPTPKAQVKNSDNTYTDVTVAARGDEVTIVAPEIAGYGSGYHVKEVTGVDANGNPVSMNPSAPSNETADANGETFTFTMPGSAVTITVVYEANKDEDLSYAFDVNFTGNGTGSLTLNVAGNDYPLSNLPDGQKTVSLDADDETIPSSKGKYVELYGASKDGTWSLPIYLAGTPVASSDSKYDTLPLDTLSLEGSSKESPKQLASGKTESLTAKFDKIQSYGYKLTVIGQGSVTGTFGDDPVELSNTTNTPVTKTSGSIVMDEAPTLSLTASATGNWKLDGVEITHPNGSTSTSVNNLKNGITLQAGITEVVVSFYDESAGAVAFQVKGGGLGNVTVKGENGKIKALPDSGIPTDSATLNTELKSGSKSVDPTTDEKTYYARVGTILTIQAKSGILTSVDVDGESVDELATAGFSYTLPKKDGTVVITVETGEKDSYNVAFQLPYTDGVAGTPKTGDIHTKTQGINEEDLKTILYSLNDYYNEATTEKKEFDDTYPSVPKSDFGKGASGLANNYGSTGSRLTQVIGYYLSTAENGDGETGRESLESTLNEIVEDEVKNNLSNIINNQKADMLSDTKREDLVKSIDDALDKNLKPSDSYSVTISDEGSIAKVIQSIRAKDDSYSKDLKDYVITATVQPILNDDQLSALSADKAASVKSVKAQLKSFILDYLDNTMTIADVSAKNAEAHVDVIDEGKGTVRIYVTASLDEKPAVSSKFATLYKDKLVTWLLSTLTVTYKGSEIALDDDVKTDVFSMSSVDFDNAAQKTSLENDITSRLGTVDTEIDSKWNDALDGVIDDDGTVYVSMKSVFDKAMLDKVIEGFPGDDPDDPKGALKKIVKSVKDKVDSVGDGANTENALMNIYRDFVVFNKAQDNLLTLKTRKGNTSSKILGQIVKNSDELFASNPIYPGNDEKSARGDSLVLYLNFDNILADKNKDNDAAYEKLVDLIVALRDGLSTDIRTNSTSGETAESVLSGLIRGQLNRSGVRLSAKKWGTDIGYGGSRAMTDMEKQELCDLAAKLIMTPLDKTLNNAWADFEKNGYQSVSLALNIDTTNRGGSLKQLADSLSSQGLSGTTANTISAGFRVEEKLK